MQNRLREIRKERGLTQKQVAELLGLDCENRLSRWEQGLSAPSLKNLLRLANIYKMPPELLYTI